MQLSTEEGLALVELLLVVTMAPLPSDTVPNQGNGE
jgi:hypothetical protein